MKIRQLVFLLLLTTACHSICSAQDSLDAGKITSRYINAVSDKSEKISGNIDKQTEKYLSQLEKQEAKLQKKLTRIDSTAAAKIFADSKMAFSDIEAKVKNKSATLMNKAGKYMPWLDTAGTSLKFLDNNPMLASIKGGATKLKAASAKVKELQDQFKQAASVKDFIRERKEYLSEQLKSYHLGDALKKYNQTAYYYGQQINDYRQAISDPEKAERKALELLNRLPAFQSFMQKNSMLAGLFATPDNYGTPQSLQGLQARNDVQQMIQGQIAAGGPNAQEMLQQNLQSAQASLSSLKNKLEQMGNNGNSSETDMPDFKPNPNKTHSFLKRIEYGINMQTVKSNYFFPVTSDIAVSAAYKLWQQNVIGIKGSYKIGFGKDIRHIAITSQGFGFGSFLDIKLKGSLFASGGFEFNHQSPADSLLQLHNINFNPWSQSGLLGISKIISLKTKFFKSTKIQLLWDFLSYQQLPKTQALKFRVGYGF